MAITSHEFEVKHNEISYLFRSASFADEASLGLLERGIRRDIERKAGVQNPTGDPYGLDDHTYLMIRAVAVFQTLLKSASNDWMYTKGANGEPVLDYTTWDSQWIEAAIAVYLLYTEQVIRFRQGRNQPAPGGAAVASGADSEPKPV